MGNDRDRVLELTGAAAYQAGIAEGHRAAFEKAAEWCKARAIRAREEGALADDADKQSYKALRVAYMNAMIHFSEQAKEKEGE